MVVAWLAALLAAWATFLPSFLFILLGAPYVERARGDVRLSAALAAVTAAVVGVILNLALFFAYHVWWPQGFSGRFDALSALITVAAAVALFRYKVGVMTLLGACALAGLAATFFPRVMS